MASKPKVLQLIPGKIPAQQYSQIQMVGENFSAGSVVSVGAISPTVTFVDENRLNLLIPNTITEDEYNVQVVNPDGKRSNLFTLTVHSGKSKRDRIAIAVVDQRIQPLPPPFNTRRDVQRVAAGSQFDGRIPDKDIGTWLDANAPTHGGRWVWPEDIIVSQVKFRTNGAEPVARGAGSGFWLYEPKRAPVLLFDLASPTTGQLEHINIQDAAWEIKQGQELRLITVSATKEMEASVSSRVDRPYL